MWNGQEPLTHDEMVDLSQDVKRLIMTTAGNGLENTGAVEMAIEKMGRLPGTACPLCGFPTCDWVADVGNSQEVVDRIKADFPDLKAYDSVCSRCAEYYRLEGHPSSN